MNPSIPPKSETMTRRTLLLGPLAAAASTLALPARAALGNARIVHGFPVGGTADITARRVAEMLRGAYAQNCVVESRTGAGGRIAAEAVKTAVPDGTTFLLTPMSTMAIYPHVFKALGYDPARDFAPVSLAATFALGLAVGPQVPATVRNLQQLLAWMRANPSQAVFGSASAGTSTHFLGALISQLSGVPMVHAPYRGSMPGITDLMGGQIPLMITGLSDLVSHADPLKLRVIATSEGRRSRFAPEVPTLAESGFPSVQFVEWLAVFAPAKTAQALVDAAAAAIRAGASSRQAREALGAQGLESRGSSPAELAQLLRADTERWGPIIRATGFTQDS
jgi:tripartite-type tricarboxylate transporter receptor subunit TctC